MYTRKKAGVMICDVCGSEDFKPAEGRPMKWCASCQALERHRHMARLLKEVDGWKVKSFLDVAPYSPLVWKGFLKGLGCRRIINIDKWRTGNPADPRDVSYIDICCDVVGMEHVLSDKFDIVMMEQVLDEVSDYMGALRSVEAVLEPGGMAYIGVALDFNLDAHSPANPNRFGNVWRFGRKSLIMELEPMFDHVWVHNYFECDWKGTLLQCQKRKQS